MAVPVDIAERRARLFGTPSSSPANTSASVLAEELARVHRDLEQAQAQIAVLKGGILEELRAEFRAAPPPAPVVEADPTPRSTMRPVMGDKELKYWLLESRDSMGNPRVVKLTPKYD